MRRAVIAAAIVIAIFLGYRYTRATGVESRYRAFAEEILHRRYDTAAQMTDGLSPDEVRRFGSQERIGAGPAMFQTLFPSKFDIQSEEKGADGSVTVRAVQTVLFNPAGVESALRPAMYAKLRQVATLKKRGGEWKIASFTNEFQEMDTLSSR